VKKLLTITALATALLSGCKSIEVTREEYASDGKTVTKRTTASVVSLAMATELEFVNIIGLGSAKAYKTDGGEATIKAISEGAAEGAVKGALKGATGK
jgi:carbon monoxide dehydrogenase subunit G